VNCNVKPDSNAVLYTDSNPNRHANPYTYADADADSYSHQHFN